jgi:hypothetical protein
MSLPAEIAADLAELELEMAPDGATPLQATWNGADYPCCAGSGGRSKNNGPGGFALDADLVLIIRANNFEADALALLKAGTKNLLTYDGRNWRIERAITPPGDPFVKLFCNDPAQGA